LGESPAAAGGFETPGKRASVLVFSEERAEAPAKNHTGDELNRNKRSSQWGVLMRAVRENRDHGSAVRVRYNRRLRLRNEPCYSCQSAAGTLVTAVAQDLSSFISAGQLGIRDDMITIE